MDGDRVTRDRREAGVPAVSASPSPASTSTTRRSGTCCRRLRPPARGELEITDVNNWYVGRGTMEADVVDGFWGDAGESIDAYYEVNDFVRRNRG